MATATTTEIPVTVTAELDSIRSAREADKPQRVTTPADDLLDDQGRPSRTVDLLPPGWTRHEVDTDAIERDMPAPVRQRGTTVVDSAGDLVHAVAQRETGPVALYAQERNLVLLAVLNDAHGSTNGHGDYRVLAQLRRTPDYQAWLDGQGLHDQVEFAEFIEDHLTDIMSPPAADMLELAQTFHAKSQVRFTSQQRLQSGNVSIAYEEDEQVTAGGARVIEIPAEFEIAVRPFYGCDRVKFTARLRYRVGRGTLQLGWQLNRPDEIESVIFAEQAGVASGGLGDCPVINGAPAPVRW